MHNLFIDNISSNLLYSKDIAVAFRLGSTNGMPLLPPLLVQYKVLPNWVGACKLLFQLYSQRLISRLCCLDGTIMGALFCCSESLFFADKRLIGQLRPPTQSRCTSRFPSLVFDSCTVVLTMGSLI